MISSLSPSKKLILNDARDIPRGLSMVASWESPSYATVKVMSQNMSKAWTVPPGQSPLGLVTLAGEASAGEMEPSPFYAPHLVLPPSILCLISFPLS